VGVNIIVFIYHYYFLVVFMVTFSIQLYFGKLVDILKISRLDVGRLLTHISEI